MNCPLPAPVGDPVPLEDLPRHNPWPARLLAAAPAVGHPKSRASVLREFDQDKWGRLLQELQAGGAADLARLEALVTPAGERVYTCRGALLRAPAERMQQAYLDYLAQVLAAAGPADGIGELGGGAGNLVLHLARRGSLASRWVSYELSAHGRQVTEMVAAYEQLPVAARPLDFDQPFRPGGAELPGRVLYFSSFALAYCREPHVFLASLLDLAPTAVVLIEPIVQFFNAETLQGLLARRYFEFNDYSAGLWPAVQRLADDGRLEIARVDTNVFGHNPLCPVSLLHLLPRRA